MNEENQEPNGEFQSVNQPGESGWQPPPPPRDVAEDREPPQMSEVGTLGSIFFEPGRVFEDLRRKPRFLIAGAIIVFLITVFQVSFIQKMGFERMIRENNEASESFQKLSAEQKEAQLRMQTSPVIEYISYAAAPIVVIISFFLGGLIYWLGANAMGGTARYLHGVSTWVYSSFPPTVLYIVANMLVLFLKSTDEIDVAASRSGLVQANPSFFIDGKAQPVLAAILSTFDLFLIWGWVLAAIGLSIIGKISSGAAWAIVLLVGLVGVAVRVIIALFS
jgi:hypothetical protein